MKILSDGEARIARALGQTLFPRDRSNATDGVDARVVEHIDAWLAELRLWERVQIRAMFQLFELGTTVLGTPGVRFSGLSFEERTAYLRGWETSGVYARRMALQALRSVYLLAYCASDAYEASAETANSAIDDDPLPYLRSLATLAGRVGSSESAAADAERSSATDEPEYDETLRSRPPSAPAYSEAPEPANPDLERHPNLIEFEDYRADVIEHCDFLVIGTGTSGVAAARHLVGQGKSVVLVEAGPVVRLEDRSRRADETLAKYFWDGGLRTTRGNAIMPTLQPRAVGGGSKFNSAICLRAPDYQLTRWADEHGLDALADGGLTPHFDEVERYWGIRDTQPEVQGPRNNLFAQACEAVGRDSVAIRRLEDGCRGSGQCMYSCPNGAKLSADVRGVPDLLAQGARVYTSLNVDKLIVRRGRVAGIQGSVVSPSGARAFGARITARATVLAAGTMATPVLMQRSGLRREVIGGSLGFHPATIVAAKFDDPVYPWYGATQGVHSLDHMEEGIKLESVWADSALMAFRVPGQGASFKRHMATYKNICTWAAWASGDDSDGSVRHVPGAPRPSYKYDVGYGDIRRLQTASAMLAEMFFAVGATEVYPGIAGVPEIIESPDDIALLRDARLDATSIPCGSNHTYGTTPMGADPERAVADVDGKVYDVDDLYIVDTSLFPSSPSANPMLTGMAVADRSGRIIADRY